MGSFFSTEDGVGKEGIGPSSWTWLSWREGRGKTRKESWTRARCIDQEKARTWTAQDGSQSAHLLVPSLSTTAPQPWHDTSVLIHACPDFHPFHPSCFLPSNNQHLCISLVFVGLVLAIAIAIAKSFHPLLLPSPNSILFPSVLTFW